jgi:hypothetical protein
MQPVAAEAPVEVAVSFQQHDRDILAGQQQGEHRAGRAGTNHAAGRLAYVANVGMAGFVSRGMGPSVAWVLIGCSW